jgi:hypothetical protein
MQYLLILNDIAICDIVSNVGTISVFSDEYPLITKRKVQQNEQYNLFT